MSVNLNDNQIFGTFKAAKGTYGFVDQENGPSAFIPPQHVNGAREGDKVIVTLEDASAERLAGEISEIVEKTPRFDEMKIEDIELKDNQKIGVISITPKNFGFVDFEEGESVFVPARDTNNSNSGDTVIVEIVERAEDEGKSKAAAKVIGIVKKAERRNSFGNDRRNSYGNDRRNNDRRNGGRRY